VRLWTAAALSILFSTPILAQGTGLGADFRKEGEWAAEDHDSYGFHPEPEFEPGVTGNAGVSRVRPEYFSE
jgi:hypothetical protein